MIRRRTRRVGVRKWPVCLLDTGDDLGECELELGCPAGQLVTPLNRIANRAAGAGRSWAVDCGSYSRFDDLAFGRRLLKERVHYDESPELCLFVVVPDVVGSARRTLECFEVFKPDLAGWPLAFVAQDGVEDLLIPWHGFDVLFVGGTTGFKTSSHAVDVVKAARICGKRVHVGRVNTPERMEGWLGVGIDSFDGTGLGLYGHMRRSMGELFENGGQLPLFGEVAK